MKLTFAIIFYAAALLLIYAGFAVPDSDGLNHHVRPRTDAEWLAALLIINGCAAKLMGHLFLFASARQH
jgi:hypothetical protein